MSFHLRKARVSSEEEFESDYCKNDPEENPSKEEEEEKDNEKESHNKMEPPKYLKPLCAYLRNYSIYGIHSMH